MQQSTDVFGSSSSTVSVISTSSRDGDKPERVRARDDGVDEVACFELHRRQVDGNVDVLRPGPASAQARAQDPAPIGAMRPVSSATRNELGRRDHAARRDRPAEQRLEARYPRRGESTRGW